MHRTHDETITDDRSLARLCQRLADEPLIAYDTEFVSEDTYRPTLCLVQVAAGDHLAIIDALAVRDLTPLWRLLAAPGHETVVHAGREEFLFCWRAIQQRPAGLMDVQLAAGLVGLEYPAAYSTLVCRLLGKRLAKGETRTNWRRRPLSQRQLDYAVLDVQLLPQLAAALKRRLERLGREAWLAAEMEAWQANLEAAERAPRWRSLPGAATLSPRGLAIVERLWRWREAEAQRRDRPPRRILRDDLIVELARRETADLARIRVLRGMEWSRLKKHLPELAARIREALELDERDLPEPTRRRPRIRLSVLTQLLHTALAARAREAQVAPGLVGDADDLRDLAAYHLKLPRPSDAGPPALLQGWRAEVVGDALTELLDGRLALRVADPARDQPLALEPVAPAGRRPARS